MITLLHGYAKHTMNSASYCNLEPKQRTKISDNQKAKDRTAQNLAANILSTKYVKTQEIPRTIEKLQNKDEKYKTVKSIE